MLTTGAINLRFLLRKYAMNEIEAPFKLIFGSSRAPYSVTVSTFTTVTFTLAAILSTTYVATSMMAITIGAPTTYYAQCDNTKIGNYYNGAPTE